METDTTAESPPVIMKSNFSLDEDVDSRLELGLGLGLSLGTGGGAPLKFLTAQDLPAVSPHGNGRAQAQGRHQLGAISGNKRAADNMDVVSSSSPPAQSQVVGWPPIRTYRINNLATQNRNAADGKMNGDSGNKKFSNCNDNKTKAPGVQETAHLGFVKVNMDGVQIGRKLDLSAHSSYESLAQIIEDMFFRPSINSISGEKDKSGKLSKLLDGSSEFVLTYEDKEGDWMLVGDVPFRMFLGTVKRLRIMRTSEANGLAPRSQEKNDRPRIKPL